MSVIIGRATPEYSEVAYRPWSEALSAGTRQLAWPEDAALAPYRRVLGLLVPQWRDSTWSTPAEAPVVLGEAVLRILAHLAAANGLLVVLDDMHWADGPTLQTLDYVFDHIAEVRVVVCVAVRDEGRGMRLLAASRRSGSAQLRLGRLTAKQVEEMVGNCDLTGLAGLSVGTISEVSAGLPLVVEDLLSLGRSGGSPQRFADIVRSRLASLSAEQRGAVRMAAALGEHLSWPVVAEAACMDDATAAEALRRAVDVDLLSVQAGEVRFRHALTAEVVANDVLPIERTEMTRSLADACMAVMAPSLDRDVLASNLFVSAGAVSRAVHLLSDAATRAEALGAVGEAAAVCGRAYQLDAEFGLAGALQLGVRLVGLRLQAGDFAEARTLATGLLGRAEGVDGSATLSLLLMLARACVAQAEWTLAEQHLGAARVLPHGDQARAELALLEAECAFGSDRPGQRAAVEHLAAKAVELAKLAALPRMECDAYRFAGRAARLRDLGTAAEALERALLLAEEARLPIERLHVLDELGTVEMLRDARCDRLERAYREALRMGAFGASTSAGLNLSSAYAMTGRHRRCAELAVEIQPTAARLGLRPLEAACELMRGIAAAFDRDREAAEAHLARAEQLAPDDADLRAGAWAIGHGVGALVDDDRPRARRAFARARSLAPQRHARILDASIGPTMLLDAVEGKTTPAAIRSMAIADVAGARWSSLWLGAALAVALARVDETEPAAEELRAALDAGDRYPLFGALVRRLVAEAAIDCRFADPVELLRDAESAFVDLGLSRPAETARGMLRSLGEAAPRQRGADSPLPDDLRRAGVTAREAEVLDMLADRHTNREIAARLFVSPKTVEKHVAALATKLGAANRIVLAEIARALHRP